MLQCRDSWFVLLLAILAYGCGSNSSNSNPGGTYTITSSSLSATQGCSDQFSAFVSSNTGGGVTDLQFSVSTVGERSLLFELNNVDVTLTQTNNLNVWSGQVSANTTLSSCQVYESITIQLEKIVDDNLNLNISDTWSLIPLNSACTYSAAQDEFPCINMISGIALPL